MNDNAKLLLKSVARELLPSWTKWLTSSTTKIKNFRRDRNVSTSNSASSRMKLLTRAKSKSVNRPAKRLNR